MNRPLFDAVVLACWPVEDKLLQELGVSPVTTPIAGSSMLERCIGVLVEHGCGRILVVLGEQASGCRALLGDGTRWGCHIHYRNAGKTAPLARLAVQLAARQESVLIASADCVVTDVLPDAAEWALLQADAGGWTGWARVRSARLRPLFAAAGRAELAEAMLAHADLAHPCRSAPVSSATADDMLEATRLMLARAACPAAISRQASRPGIWLGKGVRVHPSATLVAPLYLGDHCLVRAHAVIGPSALIGQGSVIDRGSAVRDSFVADATYVGEGLELDGCLVAGDRLANLRLGQAQQIHDPALLGATTDRPRRVASPAERLFALLAWLVLWPLARWIAGSGAIASCDSGSPLWRRPGQPLQARPLCMRPARSGIDKGAANGWRTHFVHCFHPGLRDVAARRCVLIGATPRTAAGLAALSATHRQVYTGAAVGLVNETLLLGPDGSCAAMSLVGDILAIQPQAALHQLRLLARYGALLADEMLASRKAAHRQQHAYAAIPQPFTGSSNETENHSQP